jgi:hypothetical protein
LNNNKNKLQTFDVKSQWGGGQKNQKRLATKNGKKEAANSLAHYHFLNACADLMKQLNDINLKKITF